MPPLHAVTSYITNEEKRTKIFPYALAILSVISIFAYFVLFIGFSALNKTAKAQKKPSPFELVSVSAKSAFVLDVTTGKILYQKNADEPLPLASLTKVMTAVTTLESVPDLKDVRITQGDLSPEGDSGLIEGSIWKLKDLLDYSLVVSSNDGVAAIAAAAGSDIRTSTTTYATTEEESRKIFIQKMNELAQKIGLKESKFWNEHGLDRDTEHVGAYGSARDMAELFKYVTQKYPELLEATRYPSLRFKDENGFIYEASNTNISVNEIPSLIASKTGYTDLAGGNLVIAFDAGLGRPVIISVLGSTKEKRFEDVLTLASTTLLYFKNE